MHLISSDFPWFNVNDLWQTRPWISLNAAKHQQAKQKQKKMEIPAMKTQRPQQEAQPTSCTPRPSCLPCPQEVKGGRWRSPKIQVSSVRGFLTFSQTFTSSPRRLWDWVILPKSTSLQSIRSLDWEQNLENMQLTTWFQCFSYAFTRKGLPILSANKHSMCKYLLRGLDKSLWFVFFTLCGSFERGQNWRQLRWIAKQKHLSHFLMHGYYTAFVGQKAGHMIR